MRFVIPVVVLLLHTYRAMTYGKIFPTRFPLTMVSGTHRLVLKNVSDISEFAELVHEEDDTRRLLELREGIALAKEKEMPRFTFRCICGTKYSDVFSTE